VFNTSSVNWHTKSRRPYDGQADVFAVYAPELDRLFFLPVEETPGVEARLRLEPPKNGQKKGIRMAIDYEFVETKPLRDY